MDREPTEVSARQGEAIVRAAEAMNGAGVAADLQVDLYRSLRDLAEIHVDEWPDSPHAGRLREAAYRHGAQLAEAADIAVARADDEDAEREALATAAYVHQAVDGHDGALLELQAHAAEAGLAPFFERLLEGQFDDTTFVTLKFPSDDDEGPAYDPPITTRKFPSDQEDDGGATYGGGVVTLKFPSDSDEAVTLKWPSDDDEGGYGGYQQEPDGGGWVTLKFPSDHDEGPPEA